MNKAEDRGLTCDIMIKFVVFFIYEIFQFLSNSENINLIDK